MPESNVFALSPGLLQEFHRLKTMGRFPTDQAVIKASFDALGRELLQRAQAESQPSNQRYMDRPGLSPDDYDT
jgi:hypothetical protein